MIMGSITIQYLSIIVYSTYVTLFILTILTIRYVYYVKIYGISPREVNRRLREKGISRFKLAVAPLSGRYYILPGKVGLKYEVFKIFVIALVMACIMGMASPLIGFFTGKSSLSVWNVPLIFTYTFLIFFVIGLPFALYHYYLIKSGRAEEI